MSLKLYVGSLYDLIEAVLVIMTTIIFGLAAEYFSIRMVVITGTISMFVFALMLSLSAHYWMKMNAIHSESTMCSPKNNT